MKVLLLILLLAAPVSAQEVCPVKHPALTALDHDSMIAAYSASFRGVFNRNPTLIDGSGYDDGEYWVRVSNHFGEFGDGICRAGWNAYWEQKLACRCDSVDPKLGDQPARFRPDIFIPPPPVVTPPPPPVPSIQTCDLSQVYVQLAQIQGAVGQVNANVTEGRNENKTFFESVRSEWKKILTYAAPIIGSIFIGRATAGQ